MGLCVVPIELTTANRLGNPAGQTSLLELKLAGQKNYPNRHPR